jgi:saccharopine dehydrogenase-like NADP-dependent oxidoreductase
MNTAPPSNLSSTPVLILGGGKIGFAIALLLRKSGHYAISVADLDTSRLELFDQLGIKTLALTTDTPLAPLVKGQFAVLNALPYHRAIATAQVCTQAGVHYFDLTEDVAATHAIQAMGDNAGAVLMPQCGLAPGFIGILGHDLARRFDKVEELKMRVGALPRYPTNALRYNLTWSTEGLINEYCNPCEALVDGQPAMLAPLEGYETFTLDGVEYEAFNTSGGLGTLTYTLKDHARNVTYKSVRYPGHCSILKLLLNDLRLRNRRDLLKEIMEEAIPATDQDVIVVLASASGQQAKRLTESSWSAHIFGADVLGHHLSAIQLTTASGICVALDLVRTGQLPNRGFVSQEAISLKAFLENQFGQAYKPKAN